MSASHRFLRILGCGKTAVAIKNLFPDSIMYDDENMSEFDINSDELTVVSPGIPPSNYLVQNTKNPISEYDLFLTSICPLRSVSPFTVWISGTNGKTTTTAMMQHLLEEKGSVCGGNIGTPLASLNQKANIWILETSSFTLHYTKRAKPNIYILLPISEDHISWHGNFEEYENAKLKPLLSLKEGEIAIVPEKYKEYPTDGYMLTYENSDDLALIFDIELDKINFKEPFLLDSLMALAVTKILFDEVDYKKINSFKIDAHKVEEFKDCKDRVWVDDSKATNIDATIWAIKRYKDKKIFLILGGDDKGANLVPLFEELKNYDVEIFAIGNNADKLKDLSNKYNIDCIISKKLETAVEQIDLTFNLQLSTFKSCVAILSPAAASLDQFSSYKHRGEEFKKFVYSLSQV